MQSGYNLDTDTLKRHWRLWALGISFTILAVGFCLGRLGLGEVSAEDPRWELVIASRLVLHKLFIAPALIGAAFLSGNGLFWAWDRLKVARRLSYFVTRSEGDEGADVPAESPEERTARLANAGRVYCVLLLGCFLVAAGVLAR